MTAFVVAAAALRPRTEHADAVMRWLPEQAKRPATRRQYAQAHVFGDETGATLDVEHLAHKLRRAIR